MEARSRSRARLAPARRRPSFCRQSPATIRPATPFKSYNGGRDMALEQFLVVRASGADGWLVRKGDEMYGEYLSEDSAIQDAVEAAQDAGIEAQVLVDDGRGAPRL